MIEQLIEFGTDPNVKSENKILDLKKLLVGIYGEYLNTKPEFDETEYENVPEFDYKEIYRNVKSNFPELDWYSIVLDPNKFEPNVQTAIGDALDDLTDIIKDLSEVNWRKKNTSETDAHWHFELFMRTHSEQHLVDLLKYLKDTYD